MTAGEGRVFARDETGAVNVKSIAIVVLLAFALGIGVGWGTGLVAERFQADEPTPSPTPSVSLTAVPEVSVPPLHPITRSLDDADMAAGLNSLEVVYQGEGSFTTVTADGQPTNDAASTKWVRVEFEDGLDMNSRGLSQFVLTALNDYRGWGARGRFEFVPTGGAPDLRVVIASPVTAAELCPDPHMPATTGAVLEPSPDASEETASPEEDDAPLNCADQGLIVISHFDWAAGLDTYGDERTASRVYLVNHGVGHALGEEDGVCASGRALLMTDQRELVEECEPNPWPWPDEVEPSPEPTVSPSPSAVE